MPLELKVMFVATAIVLSLAAFFGIFIYPYREHSEQTKNRTRSCHFLKNYYLLFGGIHQGRYSIIYFAKRSIADLSEDSLNIFTRSTTKPNKAVLPMQLLH